MLCGNARMPIKLAPPSKSVSSRDGISTAGAGAAARPPAVPNALVVGARPEEVRVRGERLAGLDLGPLWPTPVVRQRRDRQEEDEKIVLRGLVAFLGGLGWLVDAQHIQGLGGAGSR